MVSPIANRLISIDPGQNKCGVILVDKVLRLVLEGKVVNSNYLIKLIDEWQMQSRIDLIVIGNGTSSKKVTSEIKKYFSIPIKLSEEKNTTLRARNRYWELWPKTIFLRLIPKGLIIPSDNLDAIAALVLLEDYLKYKLDWPNKPSFKTWP